jgi:prefoldin subunit 5
MTAMGVYDQIKKAFQDIIAPELHALRGDIRLLDQKIDGLDQKIGAVDARLTVKIDAVRNEMIAEIRRVDTRIEGVDRELRTAIDIRERLAALEARHPA